MFTRKMVEKMRERFHKGKAILLLGARQVGKTTMLKELFAGDDSVLWLSGDEPDVREMFRDITSTRLAQYIGNKSFLVIDEAQRIADIGVKLKLITDNLPSVQLIATGSSAFDLANEANEPLTGRKFEFRLHPLSFAEMVEANGLLEEKRLIPHRLVFGYYPDIVTHAGEEAELLTELSESYLYKDIFMADKIKKSEGIMRLLQAIAYQVGSEVSMSELAQISGLDPKTADRYVTLLEQAYIVFRLPSFSRNLRNELKHSRKIFFWDNGVRNAVIRNYSPIEARADKGALFENFAIAERLKFLGNTRSLARSWFWRTTAAQEVDYLEELDGTLYAYEVKLNPRRKASAPLSFRHAYPGVAFKKITTSNIEDFVL